MLLSNPKLFKNLKLRGFFPGGMHFAEFQKNFEFGKRGEKKGLCIKKELTRWLYPHYQSFLVIWTDWMSKLLSKASRRVLTGFFFFL